jgi:Large polyvalent protein associated domain 38
MAEYIRLPNGAYFELKPGENAMTGFYAASQLYPDVFGALIKTPEVAPKTGIGSALVGGTQRYLSQFRTGLGGGDEAAKAGIARMEEIEKARPSQVSLEKVKEAYEKNGVLSAAGEALGQVPYAIAEQAPQIGTAIGGARLGAMAGSFLGPVGTAAGAGIGALAGQYLSSYIPTAGANLEAQARAQIAEGKPVNVSPLAAYGAAIPGAGLDVIENKLLMGKGVLGRLLGFTDEQVAKKSAQELEKLAAEKLLPRLTRSEVSAGTLLKGTAKGTIEVPTELTQQVLERAQAGLPLASDDALVEYGDVMFQAGLLSPLGGLGRISERGGAREEIAGRKQKAADAAFAAQEAAATQPANLLKLFDDYTAAKVEAKRLTDAIPAAPSKKKKPEEYAKWEEETAGAREAASDHMESVLRPLRDEYRQREDLIKPLVAQRQAAQPAAAPVTPAAPPAPPTATELMDQYDTLYQQRDQLGAQMQMAGLSGDTATIIDLHDQWKALTEQFDKLGKAVEAAGGTTETAIALDKKLDAAQKELAKASEVGDFEAMRKQAEKLAKLQEKRDLVEGRAPRTTVAEQLAGTTPAGPVEQPAPTTPTPPVTEMPAAEELAPFEAPPPSITPYDFPTPYEMFGAKSVADLTAPLNIPTPYEMFGDTELARAEKFVRDTGKATVSHIAEGLGVHPRTAAELIRDLEKAGVVTPLNKRNKREIINAPTAEAPTAEAPKVETKPAEAPPAGPVQHAIEGVPVVKVPVSELKLSQDVPQFKAEANKEGIVKPLKGKFADYGVAPIQLWRRLDGSLEIISGRHRWDLAKRSGRQTIDAQVFDEAAGFDQKKAATMDAEINIRDGQGTVSDYVNYFQGAQLSKEEAEARGLTRGKGEDAIAIATNGSPELIDAHRAKQVSDDLAASVANEAPKDARIQAVAIKAAQSKSAAEALNLMRAVQVIAPKPAEGGMADMFGFDPSAMLEAQEMAKIATQKQREVGQRLSAITGASKNPKLAAAEGIDIKDPAAVKRRIDELQQLKASWNNWTTNPTLVGEIREAMKPAEAAAQPQGKEETKAETPAEGSLAQDAQNAMFRAKGAQATPGMPAKEVESLIAPFRKLPVAPKITVVQSISELPEKIQAQMERDGTQGAPGMYHPPTKTIYLVGDNLIDGADVGKTIAHELVGHFGLRGVLGNSYPAVMRSIYQNNKQIKAEANARMQDNPEMSLEVATEESIAERAEKDVSLNWMNRLVNLIRTKLRQWGIWKGAPIGDSEIIRLIRDSHKYVSGVTTKPSETVQALAKIAPSGAPAAKAGDVLYRSRKPTKSVVAQRTSTADDLMALYTGLTGASSRDATMAGLKDKTNTKALKLRQRVFDQYASLVAAVTKGVDAGKLDAFRAQNLMYFLRFGQQRSDIVGQTVTSGPPRVLSEKTKNGTEYFYENEKGGPTLVGMAQALEKAKGYKEEDRENAFTVYLAGKRAEQVGWNKLKFDNPVEAENEYKAVLAHLKQNKADEAAFKEAEKIYQAYNAGLLDFLVQTGAMSRQKANELKQITYVPFYRVDKDGNIRMETGDERRSIRIGNIKSEPRLKELLGDSEQILPVFTSAVQNTSMLINMAMRNQTVKDTAFVLKDLGIASRIVASKGAYADNVVHFRVHGVEHHAIIDTDMYGIPAQMIVEGLEGIKVAMPAIVRMLGVPGDIFRKFTVRNPLYMFRQLVRDPVSAWVQNGTSTIPILDSFSTLAKMATGKDTVAQRLQRAGATSSNVLVGDSRDMTKFLEDLTAGKWSLDRVFSKLDTVAQQSDAATRQVIYEDSIKKGMSHQQALMRTLESMNFSRRGTSPSMYLLASLTPFMHSQVQSLDVLYRSMRGQVPGADKLQVAQRFAARAALLSLSSVAYAMYMQDDEDYKRAKPEDRYGYWWVPTLGLTKENWLKIPIPYEVGFFFKALPEAVINVAMGDEKAGPALEALRKKLGESQPFSVPQALKPGIEVALGGSFYSGPIESPHEKEILPQYRYRTSSTEVAKMLGGVGGLSPIEIDYLIRGYTGTVGMAITQMANVFLRAPEAAKVEQPTMKLSEVPLFGSLFQTSEGRGALDATYKLIEEIQQTKGAYNKLMQDGRQEEATKFANENASVLAASSMAGYMKKTLGEMSKQARMIKTSPQMTTAQKDAALENLYVNQLAMSRNFLKAAEGTTLR